MDYKKLIAPVLTTILIYVILGAIFLSLGTTIYDDFPEGNFTLTEYTKYHMILKNNAPFTFPFVNSAFIGSVNITKTTGKTECFVNSAKGYLPCKTNPIDLGYIPPEKAKVLKLK